jgi:SAM-dependent methyltransferase
MRRFLLGAVRRLLKEVDIRIEKDRRGIAPVAGKSNGREADLEALLRRVEPGNEASRPYVEAHLTRMVRTLSLAPQGGGRALELGSYGFMAAALGRVLGYREVHGAYYSAAPGREQKRVRIDGEPDFVYEVDLFDAERDAFPYADESFDLVLCCELIEHLLVDPMHVLFECHRVLGEGGRLLLTTPNAASYSSVACALHGWRNPQVYAAYPGGGAGTPHVREYTAREAADAVRAAGFAVEALFTERIAGLDEGAWVKALLEREGFDCSLRGEQTYCVARKDSTASRERRPSWLYDS